MVSHEQYAEEFREKMGQLAIEKEESNPDDIDYYRFNPQYLPEYNEEIFAANTAFGAYYMFFEYLVSIGSPMYENLTFNVYEEGLYPITDQIVEDLISEELSNTYTQSELPLLPYPIVYNLPDPHDIYPPYNLQHFEYYYDNFQPNSKDMEFRLLIINLAMEDYDKDGDFRYYQFDLESSYITPRERLFNLPLTRSIFIAQSPMQALDLFLRTENNQPNYPFLEQVEYEDEDEDDPYGEEYEYLEDHPDFRTYLTYDNILKQIGKSSPDTRDIELFLERMMAKTEKDRGIRLKEVRVHYYEPQIEIKSAYKL